MAIFVGDKGTILELEFRDYEEVNGVENDIGALDISASKITEIEFLFQKPDGTDGGTKKKTLGEVEYSDDGVDGKAKYITETGFLDAFGEWRREGKVTLVGGAIHHSTIVNFTVKEHL